MKDHDRSKSSRVRHAFFWVVGLTSLLWLILRSGGNPRRLAYPCQRAALANSAGFLGYLASLLGSAMLYRTFRSKPTPAGLGLWVLSLLMTFILAGSSTRTPLASAALSLPAWTSPTAISNVFVVHDVPIPACSLAGGTLPTTAPCNNAAYALRDSGVDTLVSQMELKGDYFYKTTEHPTGIVGSDHVVVIKVNNQWGLNGHDSAEGRLSTNTDVLKGLIWRILQHPSGFTGEVVVVENTQNSERGYWNSTPANAQDRDQCYRDVVNTFAGLGYRVSLFSWDGLNGTLISGGSIDDTGYPVGEYARGNNTNAYILLDDPGGGGTNELSYPKFRTSAGTYVSMRYGIWNGTAYDASRLTFINMPVLKVHGMAGATIAWKNLIGFVTVSDDGLRFGDWYIMHDFFYGDQGGDNRNYGLIGRQMARIRPPHLNIVDAIWVADDNYDAWNATRQNVLLAGTDPFAVDWYASEYVLRPSWPDRSGTSAARGGTFRSATRTNQNAAASNWSGTCPYMDLLDSYDGDVPSNDEKTQMNAYVASAASQSNIIPAFMLLLQ